MELFSGSKLDPGVVDDEIREKSLKKMCVTILGLILEVFWKSFWGLLEEPFWNLKK